MSVKNAKRNYIIDIAIKTFIEKSISGVTIKDIAGASGFGEATIYRYFGGRSGLIIACAMKLQGEVCKLFTDSRGLSNGYYKLEQFYGAYLKVFLEHPELYRFLSEFDAYCISENIENLEEYADNMDVFKEAFIDAYREGMKDGSVRKIEDIEMFYYSTAHAMLALCKRLAAEKSVLIQDRIINKSQEIKMLVEVILTSLRA